MKIRAAIGVLGELLITAGLVVLLFVGWQLGYKGVTETREQVQTVGSIEEAFASGASLDSLAAPPDSSTPAPTTAPTPGGPVLEGQVLSILRVPRLSDGWARPVYEGVGGPVLARGIGHYPKTAMPGEIGNFAVAGHRAGSGNPFFNINRLVTGDAVVVETREGFHVYRVTGHDIVVPTAVEVIAPVPRKPGVKPTEAYLTLTSCDPPFSAAMRYIVWAKLEKSYTRAQGLPAGTLDQPVAIPGVVDLVAARGEG